MLAILLPEWIKFRSNLTALAITGTAFTLPLLIWIFNKFAPEGASMEAVEAAWLLAPLTLVALLAPYLFTLDDSLATHKWLATTPTRLGRLIFGKVLLILCLCLISFPISALLNYFTGISSIEFAQGIAGILTSLLIMTALSLLTRSYPAVIIIGIIWMQVAPNLVGTLPKGIRDVIWSATPALGLSQYDDGIMLVRLVSVALIFIIIALVVKNRDPLW